MSDLNELREHLASLKKVAALGEQVERLKLNNDFNEIIVKGFCDEEMKRCMSLAVCEKLRQEQRELANNMAKASAALTNYLYTILRNANIAREDIADVQDAILELETKGEDE